MDCPFTCEKHKLLIFILFESSHRGHSITPASLYISTFIYFFPLLSEAAVITSPHPIAKNATAFPSA